MKEFLKKIIIVLLLMGFTNMVTARPGCHFSSGSLADDAGDLRFNKTESFTLLEFLLEQVHGLPDNIPNNEESGAHYSLFRVVQKTAVPRIGIAAALKKAVQPKLKETSPQRTTQLYYPTPGLGHFHGFLFRLTPF